MKKKKRDNLGWLAGICADAVEIWSLEPWTIEHGGQSWTGACDGRLVVLIVGTRDYPPCARERHVLALLQAAADGPPATVEFDALAKWAGHTKGMDQPDRIGSDEGEACAVRLRQLGDVVVDAGRIAPVLPNLKPSEVRVYTRGPQDAVLFEGDGWKVVLMPYNDASDMEWPDLLQITSHPVF